MANHPNRSRLGATIRWDGSVDAPDRAGVIILDGDEIAVIRRQAGTNAGVYTVHDAAGGEVYIGNSEMAAIRAAVERDAEMQG